ncbi:hypothetical protein MES4922_110227 [Mesorhizobium ventifaucium]|uniref:Uncharacterized protein n=1 Tax=Mesorhizobium ventifaucium TaxID=666020 RepID=A0ABM9DE20_9HYPH|nr:hypothetical protein MES4922_110227 [Mesorhizobium ventifaucium]
MKRRKGAEPMVSTAVLPIAQWLSLRLT